MKNIQHVSFADIYKSHKVRLILTAIFVVAAFVAVFDAGQSVGFRKADFVCGVGGRYHDMFEGRESKGRVWGTGMTSPTLDTHGAIGEIVKIEGTLLTVATPDNFEKVVRVKDATLIRRFRDSVTVKDISVGDRVVVIGSPNDVSEIEARLIRILPQVSR
jgi:hypothetical protein